MNRIHPRHAMNSAPNAYYAFGQYLCSVIDGQASQLNMSRPAAAAFVLFQLSASSKTAAGVCDEHGRKVALAFNVVLVAPAAAGTHATEHLGGLLPEVEGELALRHTQKMAAFQALTLSQAKQREALESELKLAAADAARLTVLEMQLAACEAKEPLEEEFRDVDEQRAALDARLIVLEQARANAKADGDLELAKQLGTQLQSARREAVVDFATAKARWQVKYDALAAEVARLGSAFDREAHVRLELEAHLASKPTQPVLQKLVLDNPSMSALMKAAGQAQSAVTIIFAGDTVLKSMRKQRATLAEVLGHRSTMGPLASAVSLFGTITPNMAGREMKSFDVDDAAWLSAINFVRDQDHPALMHGAQSDCLGVLAEFDDAQKTMLRQSHVADFRPQQIALSPEAMMLKAKTCEELRAMRVQRSFHPNFDAYLARMPITFLVVAGLLYVGRGEVGPLSVETMQNAIDICRWLADEFEVAVIPAPEPPPEQAHAWTLRHALQGHVDKARSNGAEHPLRILLSTLVGKSRVIGLTRAQTRNAAFAMTHQGWASIKPDGLDHVIDLSPMVFAMRDRQ